jgi:hypothetical protein
MDDFYAGSCAVWRVAEIHYIKTDVETGKTKLVGMPYYIKERYTDEERAAYESRSLVLMGMLISVTICLALVTLYARRMGERTQWSAEDLKKARRLTKLGTVALTIYLSACVLYLLIEGDADALPYALLGGYFIMAILLVELPVAHLEGLERIRAFHLLTATTGLSILTALTLESLDISYEMQDVLFGPAMFLQWIGMLVLTAFIANRAIKTARGDKQYVPRVTISAGVFLFVMFMPMLFNLSTPVLGG